MHMHIRPPFIAVIVASITYVVQVLNNGQVICNIPARSLLIAVDVSQTYSGVKSFTPNSKATNLYTWTYVRTYSSALKADEGP